MPVGYKYCSSWQQNQSSGQSAVFYGDDVIGGGIIQSGQLINPTELT